MMMGVTLPRSTAPGCGLARSRRTLWCASVVALELEVPLLPLLVPLDFLGGKGNGLYCRQRPTSMLANLGRILWVEERQGWVASRRVHWEEQTEPLFFFSPLYFLPYSGDG